MKGTASCIVLLLLIVTTVCSAGLPQIASFTATVELDGKLVMPVDVYLPPTHKSAPVVLLAHGFTQNKRYHANQGRQLAAAGYVVLVPSLQRFADHPGHARDLISLLDWVTRQNTDISSRLFGRANASRAAACGHSAGGLSALLAAAADKRFRALVLLDAVDSNGLGAKAAAKIAIPSLSVCAEPSAWNANGSPEKLAAALPQPKQLVKIAGANHLEAQDPANKLGEPVLGRVNPQRQQRFTSEMVHWISQHLPE